MANQTTRNISLGSGREGIEREERWTLAAQAASKNFAEWVREILDREAARILKSGRVKE